MVEGLLSTMPTPSSFNGFYKKRQQRFLVPYKHLRFGQAQPKNTYLVWLQFVVINNYKLIAVVVRHFRIL